jgi:hypothetical protein
MGRQVTARSRYWLLPLEPLEFGCEVAGDHIATQAHLGRELAALDGERTVEECEAVDLLFVSSSLEAAVNFDREARAPRGVPSGWLLALS